MKEYRICFVGPMLGKHAGRIPNPAEELATRLPSPNFRAYLTSSHSNRYVRLVDILWTVIRLRKKIDLISMQVYSGPSFIVEDIASWLVKRLGLRLVMVLHGGALPEFSLRYQNWVSRVLKRADQLISPSQFLASFMNSYDLRTAVIPNGMEINHYPFRVRSGKPPRLTWLRAFHPIYQPEMAVKVVHQLVREFPDISMQMIGPSYGDTHLNHTKKLIAQLDLASHIEIVGYVPKAELPSYLQESELFLNTTRYESFGITVMEAAACGMPVVTTDVGELSWLWRNGQNALTVGADDMSGMADAVRQVLTDASLCTRLSSAARRTAEQFNWSVVLPMWEKLFQEIVEA